MLFYQRADKNKRSLGDYESGNILLWAFKLKCSNTNENKTELNTEYQFFFILGKTGETKKMRHLKNLNNEKNIIEKFKN